MNISNLLDNALNYRRPIKANQYWTDTEKKKYNEVINLLNDYVIDILNNLGIKDIDSTFHAFTFYGIIFTFKCEFEGHLYPCKLMLSIPTIVGDSLSDGFTFYQDYEWFETLERTLGEYRRRAISFSIKNFEKRISQIIKEEKLLEIC